MFFLHNGWLTGLSSCCYIYVLFIQLGQPGNPNWSKTMVTYSLAVPPVDEDALISLRIVAASDCCFKSDWYHRRRSDWNSGGGTHGGTYYKSPAVEAKHIFLHYNASNLVLKILQHDKIRGTIPPLQILGRTCPPVIYAHAWYMYLITFFRVDSCADVLLANRSNRLSCLISW